jgi:MoaA/NifB/PqqE/SkfB family radical SAM enzyme
MNETSLLGSPPCGRGASLPPQGQVTMATLSQKIKLLKGLSKGDIAYVGPFFVKVVVTQRCNLRCIGCRFHSPVSTMRSSEDDLVTDISYDLVRQLCDELKAMGTNSIILTGEGEPLLHPRIFDIIATAKERRFDVSLVSNGTLLDEMKIKSLVRSRLDTLNVSLWAGSSEEYEKNYPGSDPDNFNKVIEGLKLLTRLKAEHHSHTPFVNLHHPINRNNFRNIEQMAELAYETGCNGLTSSPLKCWRNTPTSLALSQEEENLLHRSLVKMKKKMEALSLKHNFDLTILRYKIGHNVWQKLPCYIGWLHARVKVDGTVLPCSRCPLPMGKFAQEGFEEIWKGSAFREFRRTTMTLRGMASFGERCDCNFCGYVYDNLRVHRIFKWFSPFAVMNRRAERAQQGN